MVERYAPRTVGIPTLLYSSTPLYVGRTGKPFDALRLLPSAALRTGRTSGQTGRRAYWPTG